MPKPLLCNPGPFKEQFRRDLMERRERRYCMILGAGASVASGIPSGQALAGEWLRELHDRQCPAAARGRPRMTLDQWCASEHCPVPGVDPKNPGAHYPRLFDARFPNGDPEGQRFIQERVRSGPNGQPNVPSIGYAYLALLMSHTNCRVVITTNFDNLVADALLQQTGSLPRVVGHERLAQFAALRDGQPLIAKIHGDVGFVTTNESDRVARLPEEWKAPLKDILRDHIPVVVGYEGNDGSLMDFLSEEAFDGGPADRSRSLLKSGIYWCYRAEEERGWTERIKSNPRLKQLADAHQVHFVPIGDFDLWMMELGEACDVGDPATIFQQHCDRRAELLRSQLSGARARQATPAADPAVESSREQTRQTIARHFEQWRLAYEARAERDPIKADALYAKAIEVAPRDIGVLGNYANFLTDVLKEHDRAQELYKRALQADPNHANNLGNYANFLRNVRKEPDLAQEFYERALQADPNRANNLGNYATFLTDVRKEHDRAQEFFERARQAEPNNPYILGSYASFLTDVRKEHDRAQEFFERALQADPNNPYTLGSYASFLKNVRKEHDRAQEFFECALQADPNNLYILGNYANFLTQVRKEHDRAQELYECALRVDAHHASNLGNYAGFLLGRGERERGLDLLSRAQANLRDVESVPLSSELAFYSYCHGDEVDHPVSLRRLKELLADKGARSPGWDLSANVERAIADHHPEAAWLAALAKVVTADAEPTTLSAWPAWNAA